MSNVVGSFSQGYGLGQRMFADYHANQDREHNIKRRDELEQREDQQYQHGLEDRERRISREDEAYQEHKEDRTRLLTQNKEDRARLKKNQEFQDWQNETTKSEYSYQNKERQRAQDDRLMQTYYQSYLSGGNLPDMDEETKAAFDRNPQVREPLFNAGSDNHRRAFMDAQEIAKGMANGDLPDTDDPKLLNAMNYMFMDLVNASDLPTQYGGKKVTSREISRVIPTEQGGYALEQKITFEDGSTRYAPVTKNRSDAEDDEIPVISPQYMAQRLKNMAQVTQAGYQDIQRLSNFYQLHWGGSGKKSGSSTSKGKGTGSNSSSDYTKDYMADVREVANKYDERIADVQKDTLMDETQKQKRIGELNNERDRQIDEVKQQWSQFTEVGELGGEQRKRKSAAGQLVNNIVSQMPSYEFSPQLQEELTGYILNGEITDPNELSQFIEFLISDGQVKQRKSKNLDDEANDNLKHWGVNANQSPKGQPKEQRQGVGLSDAMRMAKY